MDANKCNDFVHWSNVVRSAPDWTQGGEPVKPTAPLHILLSEAIVVAKFCQDYYHDELNDKKEVVRPGLVRALSGEEKPMDGGARLHGELSREILSLKRAVDEAQTQYSLTCEAKNGSTIPGRARFLLEEISATLEWYFDDGVTDEKDEKLRRLEASHARIGDSSKALARKLYDYASLANQYRKALTGLGTFDVAYIDEALGLVEKLQSLPSTALVLSPEQREALRLRNGIVALMHERMHIVRAAARFVYRKKPELVRLVTSEHARKRQQAARRKKKAA